MNRLTQPCGLHCIKIQNLGVRYTDRPVLYDVNLHVHCGSFNVIIGKNGAGKSTLLRAILGDIPHTGTIEFRDVQNGRIQNLKIGYVPQTVNIEKNTPVSVYDMIAGFASHYPIFLPKNKKLTAKIKESLQLFDAADLCDEMVCNLSGGQLQRVLLSLAVLDEPNLLLLDEPLAGIDRNGTELFYRTMCDLKEHYDLAIILISHDLDYVAAYADHVVLLDGGTVAVQGSAGEVYESEAFARVFGYRRREEREPVT